jgi:hypothetical protein
MLFDRKDCCGMNQCSMNRPEPWMQQGPMMSQDSMMSQDPMMLQGSMMPRDDYDNRDFGCPRDCGCPRECGCPIIEAPIEKCVRRDICHEVQHVCPIHTKVINNHIYRHTYAPQYTCSEENVVSNIDQGSCCNFY